MSLHKKLTQIATQLGPGNPAIRLWLRRRCRQNGCTVAFYGNRFQLQKDRRAMLLSEREFLHIPGLARHFDTFFEPILPTEKNGLFIIDYSAPGLHTYKRSGLEFELTSWPEEESALESYFHWYQPNVGDRVFDLGAHCGVSVYHLSKLVGAAGLVVAFEPDPAIYRLLVRNVERHELRNVEPVKAAVTGTRGPASFQADGNLGSSLVRCSSYASPGAIEVETMTLEDAFQRWGTPAFCKVDIEGAEIEVLDAARSLLKEHAVNFALDTTHIVDGERTARRVEAVFLDCGYQVATDSKIGTTWARPPGLN
jgi:FkbM family methyltransferase